MGGHGAVRPSQFCPGLPLTSGAPWAPPWPRWAPSCSSGGVAPRPPCPAISLGANARGGHGAEAALHMPIIRIITVVVITAGPARGEGWAAWKLGLRSGCLAQPTNLHHINPRHLRSGLEVLVRRGSLSATSGSGARSRTDAGTGVPSARCVQGADPLGTRGPAEGPSLPPMQPLCLSGAGGGAVPCVLGARPGLSSLPSPSLCRR